jgi:MFS family permease
MSEHRITLGLRENWRQFALLAVINAFVGAMIGLERTIVPLIAKDKFAIESSLIVLSFLISFGVTKALTNLFAGRLSEHLGRKKILVAGWVVGLGVPLLLIFAKSWGWVIVANILLGINQGLCWSTTVIMKVDLVGPKWRDGGYAVGGLLSGILADLFGIPLAILAVAALTFLSGLIVSTVMYETLPRKQVQNSPSTDTV